jgi:hypothetical protein
LASGKRKPPELRRSISKDDWLPAINPVDRVKQQQHHTTPCGKALEKNTNAGTTETKKRRGSQR